MNIFMCSLAAIFAVVFIRLVFPQAKTFELRFLTAYVIPIYAGYVAYRTTADVLLGAQELGSALALLFLLYVFIFSMSSGAVWFEQCTDRRRSSDES